MFNERSNVNSTEGLSNNVNSGHSKMAILSHTLSLVSLTSIFMATSDTDDQPVDSTCGSIFAGNHNEKSYALTIRDNGAINDYDEVEHLTVSLSDRISEIDDMILANGSSKMNDMMIDTDKVADMRIIRTISDPDHWMITSTDVYGVERASDLFDDILMGVHLNVTFIKTVV